MLNAAVSLVGSHLLFPDCPTTYVSFSIVFDFHFCWVGQFGWLHYGPRSVIFLYLCISLNDSIHCLYFSNNFLFPVTFRNFVF